MEALLAGTERELSRVKHGLMSEKRQRRIVFRQRRDLQKSVHPDAVSQQIYNNRSMIQYAFTRCLRTVSESLPHLQESPAGQICVAMVLPTLFEYVMEVSTTYETVQSFDSARRVEEDGQTTIVAGIANRLLDAAKFSVTNVNERNMGLVQKISMDVLAQHVPMFVGIRNFVASQLYDENDHMQLHVKQNGVLALALALVVYAVYSQKPPSDMVALYGASTVAFTCATYQLTAFVAAERETILREEGSESDGGDAY